MIDKIESLNDEVVNALRERFHYEVSTIIHSQEYVGCNSPKPRKLAKQKMDVVVEQFSRACGDSQEIVRDAFADILIENAYDIGSIRRIIRAYLKTN